MTFEIKVIHSKHVYYKYIPWEIIVSDFQKKDISERNSLGNWFTAPNFVESCGSRPSTNHWQAGKQPKNNKKNVI